MEITNEQLQLLALDQEAKLAIAQQRPLTKQEEWLEILLNAAKLGLGRSYWMGALH